MQTVRDSSKRRPIRGPLVVVGDALLDRDLDGRVDRLCPDAPVPVVDDITTRSRPGGAALAAALLALDGDDVVLVTAIGRDGAGDELRALIEQCCVDLLDLGHDGATPEKVRVRAGALPVARLDYGGARALRVGPVNSDVTAVIGAARGILVADYGRGVTDDPGVSAALRDRHPATPLVWDPHPRGASPVAGAELVTPNDREARGFAAATDFASGRNGNDHGTGDDSDTLHDTGARAEHLRRVWSAGAVAVTRGRRGALLSTGGAHPLVVPAEPVTSGDTCGAGDRFASTATAALAVGAVPSEAVVAAVAAATAFVAAGGAGGVRFDTAAREQSGGSPAADVAAAVRARGGTVVATSGCFDLLHAGHVSALRAARSLGDLLIVCLNSDESVRRLKGSGRPLVPESDRAEVLRGLTCVDEVVIFDDDTPVRALERIRPHLFVKGGDYGGETLVEAEVLARWGGQAVIVPYLEGRSTTRLVQEVRRAGA
ncbi:MAG: D-glycero-beta-D-manno-heptose 1-phosphate adenylyltransferase [Actinobacteria bacterium]|nr:D-glycero-beta-D-manno-heptose 1-phosphate adenylyltransferase [Actinomycetota bacterium]